MGFERAFFTHPYNVTGFTPIFGTRPSPPTATHPPPLGDHKPHGSILWTPWVYSGSVRFFV